MRKLSVYSQYTKFPITYCPLKSATALLLLLQSQYQEHAKIDAGDADALHP